MATDDRFKQYSEAGEEFLEAARSRAVEFLRELARVGQVTQKQATGQVDDLVDAGRRGTDQIIDVIRREIAGQLGALGLATKDDLAALERRLQASGRAAPVKKAAPSAPTPSSRATPAKRAAAPAKKAAGRAAGAGKAAAKRSAGTAKAAPAKAPGATKRS